MDTEGHNVSDIYVTLVDCVNGLTVHPCEDGETSLEHAVKRAQWLKDHCGYDDARVGKVVLEPVI